VRPPFAEGFSNTRAEGADAGRQAPSSASLQTLRGARVFCATIGVGCNVDLPFQIAIDRSTSERSSEAVLSVQWSGTRIAVIALHECP
jgi:hypothetical protein